MWTAKSGTNEGKDNFY